MATPTLAIELNRETDPPALLAFSYAWQCQTCLAQIALVIGEDWQCVQCMFEKAGKPEVQVLGWKLTKSILGQINLSRVGQ